MEKQEKAGKERKKATEEKRDVKGGWGKQQTRGEGEERRAEDRTE